MNMIKIIQKFTVYLGLACAISFPLMANAKSSPTINPFSSAEDLKFCSDNLYHSAKKGKPDAQFLLAHRLHKGKIIPQNMSKSIELYTQSAKQGITPAQLNLGIIYAMDAGYADESKARFWLEKAASGRDNRASYVLAKIYEKQDKLMDAYKWYDISSRQQMLSKQVKEKALIKTSTLRQKLNQHDLHNAQILAEHWFNNSLL